MIDWAAAQVVTTSEFEVCWEQLQLGETPWQLDPPRSGLTAAERATVVSTALRGLVSRGLAFGQRPGARIEEHLRRLAAPHWSVDVRYVVGSVVAAVAAAQGSRATVAVRHEDRIALLDVPADDAVDVLVELPGPAEPGPGRDVRLPATVLDAVRRVAEPGSRVFGDELVDRGVERGDADRLAVMCRDVRLRGQFGATTRTGDGSRTRRAPHVVGFHSTPDGRFRQLRRGPGAAAMVTVGPAGCADLRREVLELL